MSSPESQSGSNKTLKAPEFAAFVGDSATEQTVNSLIQEEVMTFTVVRRGSCRDAVRFLETSLSPQILLVDISGIALPLSEIDQLMNACEPSVAVLVVGETNDIGLFRNLIQLGVNDYLVKPLTVELIRRTIARFTQDPNSNKPKMRTGKIVAVTGSRGGIGTTTLLVNLGWTLAHDVGRRVILVDLDVQYSALGLMLGQKRGTHLVEALNNAHRIDSLFLDRMLVQHGEKLYSLSAESGLDADVPVEFSRLQLLIRALENRFHYIMIDLPRRPGSLFKQILEQAQVSFVIAAPTVVSARDVVRILQISGRQEIGRRAVIVLNHVAPPSKGDVTVKEFEAAIGRKVDYVVPYSNKATLADNTGIPLVSGVPMIKRTLLNIANDLSGRGAERASGVERLKRMLLGR